MKKLLLVLLVITGYLTNVNGQEVWTLEKCILHAQQNNLSLKRNALNIKDAEITVAQSKHARYPSLNSGINAGFSLGRSIDPSTNDFISQSFTSNGLGINTSVNLFRWGAFNNAIKRGQLEVQAVEQDAAQMENQVSLFIASAYLNILFAEERLENAIKQLELSTSQLDQINKLINAGSRPESEKYALEAQVASGEQTVIQNENNLELSLLNLKNLLQLEPDYGLQIAKPDISVNDIAVTSDYSFEQLFSSAMQTQPQIRAGDLRLRSADLGVKIAKTNLLPSLSASGGISSYYSTQGLKLDGFQTVVNDFTVQVGGQDVTLSVPQDVPVFIDNPYLDQINENIGYQATLSLNIPIYNNWGSKANIQRSEIATLQMKLANEEMAQTLKSDVMTALTDSKAAQKNMEASQKSLVAQEIALQAAQKKYDVGTANNYELITAQNNYESASINFLIAKYDYLYKLTLVDYYAGKPIRLNR